MVKGYLDRQAYKRQKISAICIQRYNKVLVRCFDLTPNTVVFFKLDRGDSLLDGKMRKIITFGEIISVNVNILMVYWSRLWTLTWQAGVQFPAGDFTIFLKILQFSQTLRNYYRFQQSLAKLKPFPHKSLDSGLPLDSNKTSGTCWYVYENWSWKLHFSRSRTDKKWSWVRIPHFPMPF